MDPLLRVEMDIFNIWQRLSTRLIRENTFIMSDTLDSMRLLLPDQITLIIEQSFSESTFFVIKKWKAQGTIL